MRNRTLKEALHKTIHQHETLSVEAMAEELGVSASYLYRSVLPDEDMSKGKKTTGVRFPLKQLAPLIRLTGDFQALDHIEQSLGRVAIPLPPTRASVKTLQIDAMKAVAEFGDLMRVLAESCADNTLDKAERRQICKEGYEAVQAIMQIVASCEASK